MSRNFLSLNVQQVKLSFGVVVGGMAYQMTHLPPPPQRLTRKFYKSKNSSNFLSPTKSYKSRIFYVQQVKLSFGMVVGEYGIPDDTPPHHHLKDWQENFISPKIQAIF